MLALSELLHGANLEDQDELTRANLATLLFKLNQVRADDAWGQPMTVTSGLRAWSDMLRIYQAKAASKQFPFTDGVFDQSKIPRKSKHLFGQAADISDPNQELQAWCRSNEAKLAEIGLWMEDFSTTPNWVHFQVVPPGSGKRWFMP